MHKDEATTVPRLLNWSVSGKMMHLIYFWIKNECYVAIYTEIFLLINTLTATTPVFECQQIFWSGRVTHILVSLIRLLAKDHRRYLKRYSIIIKLLNCYKSNTKMLY